MFDPNTGAERLSPARAMREVQVTRLYEGHNGLVELLRRTAEGRLDLDRVDPEAEKVARPPVALAGSLMAFDAKPNWSGDEFSDGIDVQKGDGEEDLDPRLMRAVPIESDKNQISKNLKNWAGYVVFGR